MSKAPDQPICSFCKSENGPFRCRTDGLLDKRRLAETWLQYRRESNNAPQADSERAEELSWAYDCVDDMINEAPQTALDVILLALSMARDNSDVGVLAAGPLEDLIVRNGTVVIDRIEIEVARSAEFRQLLSGTWSQGSAGTEVWQRIQRAVKDGPWLDEDPRTPQGTAGFTKKQ
jgi:hypothetical protein